MLLNDLRLMRVHHYIKNLLVMLPLIFGGSLLDPALLGRTALAFLAFSLLSSTIYIFNDLQDVEKDRLHPKKCHRPIASGAVSQRHALALAGVLLAASLVLCLAAGGSRATTTLLLGLYLILNLLYSRGLKNRPIVDIAILTSGFLLRVLFGAAVTGIPVSNWLYLTVISFSFYCSLGKRRGEFARTGSDTRAVLRGYTYNFLDKNMYLCLTMAIIFYSLWSVDSETQLLHPGAPLVWTVPLVMLICLKYSLTVETDSDGDPVEVLLGDKLLVGLCAVYGAAMLLLLYWF